MFRVQIRKQLEEERMGSTHRWWRSSLLVLLCLVVTACGGTAPAATTGEATSAPAAAATEAPAAAATEAPAVADATAAVAEPAASGAVTLSTNPEDYGLQPGKPYDGTQLNFLICCPTAGQFAALTKRTADFQAMTGISVTWDAGPYGAFQEKLLTEASTGSGTYDVVAWVDSWGEGLKQYLVPLNDRIAQDGIDMADFPPAYVQAASGPDGTVYGLPLRGHAQVLFYRKDVFEQLGLEPPTTWQEVVSSGKIIREQTELDPISMYYGVTGGQNLFIWLNMLWSNGGDIFDAENRPVFNNEAGLEATQQYINLLTTENLANPGSVTFGETEANQEIGQGRAAMFVGWSWIYETFATTESAAPEVVGNIGVVPAPTLGNTPISYGYIWPTGILQSSQNQDAAWEYIKWMTSQEVERAIALDKSDPSTNNIVVVRLSNLRDPEINASSDGLHEVMATMLETARTQPLIPEWPEVQSVLEVALNEMANGADVQATLDRAQQEVDEIMQRGGYY
jgi:multiple sugar transport system substrate-binding protein